MKNEIILYQITLVKPHEKNQPFYPRRYHDTQNSQILQQTTLKSCKKLKIKTQPIRRAVWVQRKLTAYECILRVQKRKKKLASNIE